jgi:hypothetical protein
VAGTTVDFIQPEKIGAPNGVGGLDAEGRQDLAQAPYFQGVLSGTFAQPGMTDDQIMQAALNSVRGPASAFGTRTVSWTGREFVTAGAFDLDNLNNVTINMNSAPVKAKAGAGRVTAFQMYKTVAAGGLGSKDVRLTGVRVTAQGSGLKTNVGIVDSGGAPRRARETWSDTVTPPAGTAQPYRDYRGNPDRIITVLRVISTKWTDGIATSRARYEDVTIDHCDVFGTEHLPVWVQGCYGTTRIEDNYFERCLDPGVIWSGSVEAHRNISRWSADNGLSLSRGNDYVHASYNDLENAWFSGIMVGTFEGDRGPLAVNVHHNRIVNAGEKGINCDGGSQSFDIHDNFIDTVTRGALSNSNFLGVGIYISGLDATTKARNGRVHHNIVANCHRGGIQVADHVDGLDVRDNTAIRPGSPLLTDGATVPSEASHNFGHAVRAQSAATVINATFAANRTFDDRTMTVASVVQPVTYWGVYIDTAVGSVSARDNAALGTKLGSVQAGPLGVGQLMASRVEVGSATATDARITKEGATEQALIELDIVNGVIRRKWSTTTTTERQRTLYNSDGSNGVVICTEVSGTNKHMRFETPIRLARYTTALRPTAAGWGSGSVFYDTDLKKVFLGDNSSYVRLNADPIMIVGDSHLSYLTAADVTGLGFPSGSLSNAGWTPVEAAFKAGAVAPKLSADVALPASTTAVAITTDQSWWNTNTTTSIACTAVTPLGPTYPGTVTHTSAGGSSLSFTRTTAGAAVTLPAGTRFVSALAGKKAKLLIAGFGRNVKALTTTWSAQIMQHYASIAARANADDFLVATMPLQTTMSGSTGDSERAHNALVRDTYPHNLLDLAAYYAGQMIYDAGLTPDATDLANMATGTPPPRAMSGDTTHTGFPDVVRAWVMSQAAQRV